MEGNKPTDTNSAVPKPKTQKVKAQIAGGILVDIDCSVMKLNFITTKFSNAESLLKEEYHKKTVINITAVMK
jgi:hypothetical protein